MFLGGGGEDWGVGFGDWGLGFGVGVLGLGFRCLGFAVWVMDVGGCGVCGLWFGVYRLESLGLKIWVCVLRPRIWGLSLTPQTDSVG